MVAFFASGMSIEVDWVKSKKKENEDIHIGIEMPRTSIWVVCLVFLISFSNAFIFPNHGGILLKAGRGSSKVRNGNDDCTRRGKGNCIYSKDGPGGDDEKRRAKQSVKADLDRRGLYVFGVVLLLNARFTFMPQEIRTTYTCPSGPNRDKSIAEFKATNPNYVCNEPAELFLKYLTAPLVPPPSGDLILAKPLLSTKYGTGENVQMR